MLSFSEVNEVRVTYALIESARKGASNVVLMKTREDFYKYAVEQFTAPEEEVVDVCGGETNFFFIVQYTVEMKHIWMTQNFSCPIQE